MRRLIITKLDSDRLRGRLVNIKEKTGKLNAELEMLLAELDKASIVESTDIPGDIVTMNTRVKVEFSNNTKPMVFQIVYPEKADLKSGRISIFAPVATALIGYKKGDKVKWKVPSGEIIITIREILFQPEAAGEFDL